jgi:hypothetical protein
MDTEVAHSRDCCNSKPFYSGRQQYGLRVMAPTALDQLETSFEKEGTRHPFYEHSFTSASQYPFYSSYTKYDI